jgi:hypothetical protein
MADERRYDEDEIREIFGLAARTPGADLPAASSEKGLTLADLQEIGLEVGLSPERVAEAALQMGGRATALRRYTYLGMPISVGRTVDLPRAPTEREWEVLVADLRETFDARGRVSVHGNLREWTNGNLHVYLETTETGPRLRMRTVKGSAVAANRIGFAFLGLAVILFGVLLLTGQLAEDLFMPLLFAAMGAAAVGSNAISLPRWAREREGQMDYIARRAQALLEEG